MFKIIKFKKVCTFIISLFLVISNIVPADASENQDADCRKNIDLIIVFKDDIDSDLENLIVNSGGEIVMEYPELGGIEVKCLPSLIPDITSLDSVESLSPNHVIKLSSYEEIEGVADVEHTSEADLYDLYQWDIKKVTNDGESYKLEKGNHDVVIGIIDSGVDKDHPDLVSNFMGGKNLIPAGFSNDASETGNMDDVDDRIGHGTCVTGIIAADGRAKGVAPGIGFKSYRVFNRKGETTAGICSSAIINAVDDGVKVINLSVGGYDLKGKCFFYDPETGKKYKLGDDMAEYSLYKRAIKYATQNGVVVVASAGNEHLDCADKSKLTGYLNSLYNKDGFKYEGLTYEVPGTVKNVITVSATGNTDVLARYSNYGKNYIDVTAPGGDKSTENKKSDMCMSTTFNSSYAFVEGTSFSAPKVAATAGLILCKNADMSPKQVAKRIYKTSDKLYDGTLSEYYGSGMVNVYNALNYSK